MLNVGWSFDVVRPDGTTVAFTPRTGATVSLDLSRDTRRTLSGLVLDPAAAAAVDLVADRARAFLTLDGIPAQIGLYSFTEDSLAEDAVLGPGGAPADLVYAEAADGFTRLRAAIAAPLVAHAGADPAQIMIALLDEVGLPNSIAGAVAPLTSEQAWPAGTPLEAIISGCAELAGHRRPWADNTGTIRSVAALVVDSEVIDLADLNPLAGTVLITNVRLSAPNRVVVVDDSADFPTTGVWNAPASAPNSAAARGWVTVEIVAQQGLSGAVHATAIAETLGERLSARRLSATIPPTARLDGPVVLAHRGTRWIVTGWSTTTAPGATMSLDATEFTP